MKTEIVKMDYAHIDMDVIHKAGEIIRLGGLVAFPTETVYGLGGDALNPESSRKIYAAKGRPSDNPLIVHIADKEDLYQVAAEVSDTARKLIDAFWPGPLTMIFKKKSMVPDETTGGLPTVAVRMPSDPVAAAFIKASGGFVSAPSANVSGRPSTTMAEHVIEDLSGKIDMILDGGQAVIGLESSIVDVSVDPPVVLRPGVITKEMVEEITERVEVDQTIIEPGSKVKPKAPGMKYRHYAPKADLTVVEGEAGAVVKKITELAQEAEADGDVVGILATDETADCYSGMKVISVGSRQKDKEVARHLFEALRKFDETNVTKIYSESFEKARIGAAIMNRLMKAAGNKLIKV